MASTLVCDIKGLSFITNVWEALQIRINTQYVFRKYQVNYKDDDKIGN